MGGSPSHLATPLWIKLEFSFCSQLVIENVDRQLIAASGPALSITAYCFILERIGFDFF